MTWVCRRASALFQTYYALMLAYRGEILLWAVAMALPLIMAGVWVQAAGSGRFPLDPVQAARYYLAAFLLRQFTVVWVIHEFEWHVVSGRLSPLLLQPMNPVWRWVVAHLAEQASRLPFALILLVLGFVIFPQALWGGAVRDGSQHGLWLPAWWQVLLALVFCYFTFAVRFLMQFALSMGSFWYERVMAWERLLYVVYLFASGMLFPLETVPEPLRSVLLWTPFPYMVWFPAMMLADGDMLIRQGGWDQVGQALVVMLCWGLAFWALGAWLWRRGLKHYSAMGA